MVRETRHLWVGNLPDNIREDRIREHFKRYGRVQSIKLLPRVTEEKTGEITMACTVAFMDIKSASKAHNAELKIDDRTLNTEYYEPAAIPSAAASPQNTPSPYSTSPGATRFPNGHGSSDEHGTFPERFYDRSTARVAPEGEFIRRTGYHDTNRGRNRDRSYRNGPYNNLLDRHSRTLNNSWTYDSTRYNSTTTGSQSETGYITTPSDSNERRNSDQSARKKTKSRSGSRSPSPSGSASSRSPSRSRSQSSSSTSSSSTSRDTSSTSSPKSRRQASANQNSEDRRPLAICVKNLPLRSSDTSLKDGLFHEYKKHGKVTWVKVVGQSTDRHAIVCFKKPEDVEKALEVSYDKLFFGCKIEVAPHTVCDVEDNDLRPYEAEIDEYHPKATRTLFIGNLEKEVTASDLRKHFDQFGEIIEIDIKKQGTMSSYAFCQYSDIVSVVKAIRKMDGEHLGNNRIKLGFGKSMPYNCVWIDGVNENVNEKYLRMQFEPFGVINKCIIDREKGQALIFYEQVLHAQQAVNKMRGFMLKNTKLQVDFASRECQECFFERLEKQGTILDRTIFEERRDSTSRNFETSAAARFSRYDTPTRPRTSSYSSRSSAAASQVTSAIPSPGTPGSVTPRGTGSRSRVARFAYDYDQTDYPDRHFRSYDEYSQGSAASHEDTYEHEYAYVHDSPTHLDPLEVRVIHNVVDAVPFAPPDIRNLQKERVHLLEQLEECPSSGDEVISPKKRLKLDLLDAAITSDVIIEANRDHRKVMEVRRLSDANLRHHSRRPSIDSKYKDLGHDRGGYLPHAVGCKRRKTAGSDNGSRVHHYDHSGSESVGGSRPGTPLCDEKPENFPPSEPRRVPREREGPLTLPLPRFAAQITNRGSVSVAGIKGQKDNINILSSPPPAATSPRISNPRPPSPVHVPPPASPPPRPPSLSSNSSDSDINPPSPSLEERLRSLDEKYEKWSGSRALSAAGGDALAMLDANKEKFRLRHKLLDLDLKEVQPSEIVKSVMAKRSVFDEDLKRLENVGEKYEPKDFSLFPRATTLVQTSSVPVTPLSAPPILKIVPATQLPKTPTMLSPRSAGTGIPAAKGLQYPFPSHPPIQMSPATLTLQQATTQQAPTSTTTASSLLAPTSTSTTTIATATRSNTHGDNRLKPCANVASDTRTSSKVNMNRSTVVSQIKSSEKNNINIPNTSDIITTTISSAVTTNVCGKVGKPSDKASEKVTCRRDSNSSSPRADIKTRRNSDTSARRIDDSEKFSDNTDTKGQDRAKSEERRKEQRLEKARLEAERLEKEKAEKERIEQERLEKEKAEKESLERERLEKERLEKESELEKQRLEKERLEKERLEKERQEKERLEKERLEKERAEKARLEKEKLEKEKLEKTRLEKERQERERAEKARLEKERAEKERLEKEKQEQERLEKERRREKEEKERKEREEREHKEMVERERKEREQEKELLEKKEQERKERERREREEKERREEDERREKEKDRSEKEKLEKERKRDEERSKHKEDNHHHEKRKDDHGRYRENHSESKHKENNIDKHLHDISKNAKDTKEDKSTKEVHDLHRRDSHDFRTGHEKSRHHADRDAERRKESIKENRDNNIHDKHKNLIDMSKDRAIIETRHLSIDLDKNKTYEISPKLDPNKRKERNNSLPANIGSKRRNSSHETMDISDESKRIKLSHEHKKFSERRDSKDGSRSEDKSKSGKHKNNTIKSHEKHKDPEEKRKEKEKEREERHKKHRLEKQKSKSKSREKDSRESPITPKSPLTDKDFLARLNLRSNEEIEKQRKEAKEKRKDSIAEVEKRDDKKPTEEIKIKKEPKETDSKDTSKIIFEETSPKTSEERKSQKRERIRKITNSTDSDSDEPKKHSIFDIVDDEPAYISMYDKVKARSCKNMQKLEEEKRQEKIKAKFSQLKQSRARREEKKRSTSWDEDDSESDKETSDGKIRKCLKILLESSDESQERRVHKKREIYSDSDSSILRQIKSEQAETTDDEIKNKHVVFKACKSRITSDTSDDEYRKNKVQTHVQNQMNSDLFSENEHCFADTEEKPDKRTLKNEIERLIKKERQNSKYQESVTEQLNTQIFGESNSPLPETKSETYNSRTTTFENTSDDEAAEIKKERREKKHKKKQKKLKHSVSSEESCKLEDSGENTEKTKHHEKKKEHCKKEKKRDKTKEGREKTKKSKKNKSESKCDVKRDGKMENIFGPLSEDSENGVKDVPEENLVSFRDENVQKTMTPFNSDSDREHHEVKKEDKDRERDKEEHKRRKEKKRREKERRIQEAAAAVADRPNNSNDNSMDFADMGKQLEANIKDDASDDAEFKNEKEVSGIPETESFCFKEQTDEIKKEKGERKEIKEKKKKRKKSKEEKGKHHHHHHHDKNKIKSPDIKKEQMLSKEDIKIEIEEPKSFQNPSAQSLPSIFDMHSPPESKTPDFTISPSTRETIPIISPIPKTPTTSKEKKRDKLIPGFGAEIDEKIHESAIKSISEFEPVVKQEEVTVSKETKEEKTPETEEKPRVVISQEETEDAVAALLGESFGGDNFDECYTEENSANDSGPNLVEENVQDDEEMRQAVQSLSAADLDVKPDTPQSEHDLQIDTDTEEQEELSNPIEQPPKTSGIHNFAQPPKTPVQYVRSSAEDKTTSAIVYKSTKSIGSPPSLTPIKHQSHQVTQANTVAEVKKNLAEKCLPASWPSGKEAVVPKSVSTHDKIESKTISEPTTQSTQSQVVISQTPVLTPPLKTFTNPPIVKISDTIAFPHLTPLVKDSIKLSPVLDQKVQAMPCIQAKVPNTSQLHNLPARSPVQITKPPTSVQDASLLSPKSTAGLTRLPITPVMVSKPLQATNVILPQSKIAHSLEPPKLISTPDPKYQERSRMVFQTSAIQGPQYSNFIQNPPRMLVQGNIRHLPPQNLLVPARNVPPSSYSFMGNIAQPTYNMPPTVKENQPIILEKSVIENTLKLPQSVPPPNLSLVNSTQNTQPKSTIIITSSSLQHPPSNLHHQPSHLQHQPSHFQPQLSNPKLPSASLTSKPVSQSSLATPKTTTPCVTSQPFIPVHSSSPKPSSTQSQKPLQNIEEAPKLVSLTPSSTPENLMPTTIIHTSKSQSPQVRDIATKLPSTEININHPPVINDNSRKSTPSPVIVPNPNESMVPEIKSEEPVKPTSPVKLAIEKVTEELNMSLKKEVEDSKGEKKPEEKPELAVKDEPNENIIKEEPVVEKRKVESETISVIKEIEKFTEEKADLDSNTSDISKERSSSADILSREDPLDTKEDSDYWSAKEVNIDSVIKNLCSADEMSDHSSENGKDEWLDHKANEAADKPQENCVQKKSEETISSETNNETEGREEKVELEEQKVETPSSRGNGRGRGRGGRGRKARGGIERGGIQTRRGKLAKEQSVSVTSATINAAPVTTTPTKRGRAGRPRNERKPSKSESDTAPNDVYEFRDDSDDNNKEQRPRLVLTIKSSAASSTSNSHTTAIVKEITKDGAKEIGKEATTKDVTPVTSKPTEKEEFVSPQTNTRKSRRLQEKDISRNTVDDTIEDVVKNTVQTRAGSRQARSVKQVATNKPQATATAQPDTPRKSPRGRKPRRASEAADNSSSEEAPKEEVKPPKTVTPPPAPQKEAEKPKEAEKETPKVPEPTKDKSFESVKAVMLRRLKGELANANSHEPTNLIDPVTGLLIPMRECEEGRYIPLPGSSPKDQKLVAKAAVSTATTPAVQAEPVQVKTTELAKTQPSVIAQPQQATVVQQQIPKPQTLKAHVLSSQAAKAIVSQTPTPVQAKPTTVSPQPLSVQPQKQTKVVTKTVTPIVVSKPLTPVSQNLNPTSVAMVVSSVPHLPSRQNVPIAVSKPQVKPTQTQQAIISNQQKQFLHANKQQPAQPIPKAHMASAMSGQSQIVNTQIAHMKQHQNVMKQQQAIMGKGALSKPPHSLHQQQILTAQVASPPISKSQVPGRVIQGPSPAGTKGMMEPPKVDVSLTNVIHGRPSLSPQGTRVAGLQGPGYEASLGEAISHFPPGPLPAHYMHPSHVMQYQQFLRQQQLQHLQRAAGLEKSGEEGEEAPVTSPPLELRRPGSVGLALSGRGGAAVPHSLHSPHDRATESPQMGQVYNTLQHSRMPPYHPNRYMDQTEPPPAHRPLTSHGSLAALGSDRGLAHMAPLTTPDHPLSGHLQPDRPLSGHIQPDRPLSGHSMSAHMGNDRMTTYIERPLSGHGLMSAGLGAAGNLMGAVAKHIGAEAPTSQRGLQAATPPHASQVPPQAESLFMLLKQYPLMWQGLLALKNDQAAVQMYFVSGNDDVAKCSLPKNTDGSTPPLRIFQRMRLEPPQVEGVARKMQMENEHCMLLALPCGHDHMDVLKQSTNLSNGFITYLQQKQAAGIVNVAAPGTTQPPAYVVHIFPSCDFVNENLRRIAPSLLERVADIAHLLIVITTV